MTLVDLWAESIQECYAPGLAEFFCPMDNVPRKFELGNSIMWSAIVRTKQLTPYIYIYIYSGSGKYQDQRIPTETDTHKHACASLYNMSTNFK